VSLATLGSSFADAYVNSPRAKALATPLQPGATPSPTSGSSNALGDTLKSLASYIPSEVLTLYLSASAAIASSASAADNHYQLTAFLVCLALTPIWAFFAVFLAAKGPVTVPAVSWPMISGTIAFAAYAFAVPTTVPSGPAHDWRLFATIAVLAVTPMLHLGGLIYARLFPPN